MASEIFSRKYFNKHFLVPALELVHDPVANVRSVCWDWTGLPVHLSVCLLTLSPVICQVQAVPAVATVTLLTPSASR